MAAGSGAGDGAAVEDLGPGGGRLREAARDGLAALHRLVDLVHQQREVSRLSTAQVGNDLEEAV